MQTYPPELTLSPSSPSSMFSHPSAVPLEGLLLGVATSAGQSEDALDDAWLAFCEGGGCAAWNNTERPEERLQA